MAKKPLLTLLQKLQQNPWYTIIPILLTAAIFRLFFINLIEFKYDEATTLSVVIKFYNEPYIQTNSGISSTGVNNFPLFYNMMTLLGTITRDPEGLSWLIGLINTLLIIPFYFIINKYYGQLVATFAALVIATSPWLILFSRKIWGPDLIFVLMVPILYFLHQLIIDQKKSATLWLFLLLTLLFQLHLSGLFLFFVTLVLLLALKVKFNYKKALIGILIGLIPTIPYFWANFSSGCFDCKAFSAYQTVIKPFYAENFIRQNQILTGAYFENSLGQDYPMFLTTLPLPKIWNILFYLEMIVPIIGLFFILKYRKYIFLAFYPILIPIGYYITKTPAHMYYFVILAPFIAVLYGIGVKNLTSLISRSRLTNYLIYAILLLPLLANLIFMFTFFNFIATKKVIAGDYGTAFELTKEFLENELIEYENFPNYEEIKLFAYQYHHPQLLHSKLGEFFARKSQPQLAINEFQKAVAINPNDLNSRANLTFIYLLTGNLPQAQEQLIIIKAQDPKLAESLEQATKSANPR